MPKWTEYTSKDTLADNDEVMLYDATARANKRGLMSKFWDYVVDKMSTAVISKLETNNKTIIGAINALNSNKVKNVFPPDTASFFSSDKGIYLIDNDSYKNFSDKPSEFYGRAIWIYNRSGNNDERVGILICSRKGKAAIGYCYGGNSLSWNIIK